MALRRPQQAAAECPVRARAADKRDKRNKYWVFEFDIYTRHSVVPGCDK